jgi:hypothetical protein
MNLQVSFPFLFVTDRHRRSLGFVAITGPFFGRAEVSAYRRLSEHFRMIGLTSYMDFPGREGGFLGRRYVELCEGWCHGLRNPADFFPLTSRLAFISQSDFIDPSKYAPGDGARAIDFVYVCGSTQWQALVKNWALGRRILPVLCEELGLRGVLVGRVGTDDVPPMDNLAVMPFLARNEFHALLRSTRFLLVPSILDASPRILAEAMCSGVAIVVNRQILGGWKYVSDETGGFFEDVHDLKIAVDRCYQAIRPRDWYAARYGPSHAGDALMSFLQSLGGHVPDADEAILSSFCTL